MGAERPKQYFALLGKTVLEHSVQRLQTHTRISGVVVAVAEHDSYGNKLLHELPTHGKPLISVSGGAQRCHSVLNALQRLAELAAPEDWVLVHDAVRPCLRHADIDRLINALTDHPGGGLLGTRVNDTLQRVNAAGEVVETVDRAALWHAQTPQMFRLGALRQALDNAMARGVTVTDEATAMSLTGTMPLMVEGHADNIKITHMPDLALAEFYLKQQEIDS